MISVDVIKVQRGRGEEYAKKLTSSFITASAGFPVVFVAATFWPHMKQSSEVGLLCLGVVVGTAGLLKLILDAFLIQILLIGNDHLFGKTLKKTKKQKSKNFGFQKYKILKSLCFQILI